MHTDYKSKADAHTDAATDVHNIQESGIKKKVHETAYRNQAECTQHTGIKQNVHSIQESSRMYTAYRNQAECV